MLASGDQYIQVSWNNHANTLTMVNGCSVTRPHSGDSRMRKITHSIVCNILVVVVVVVIFVLVSWSSGKIVYLVFLARQSASASSALDASVSIVFPTIKSNLSFPLCPFFICFTYPNTNIRIHSILSMFPQRDIKIIEKNQVEKIHQKKNN